MTSNESQSADSLMNAPNPDDLQSPEAQANTRQVLEDERERSTADLPADAGRSPEEEPIAEINDLETPSTTAERFNQNQTGPFNRTGG